MKRTLFKKILAVRFNRDGENVMKNAKSKQGLTLTEVVIACLILFLTLSAFLASFMAANRSAKMADNYMDGMHTARQTMEALASYDYDDSSLSIGTHLINNGSYTVSQNATYTETKDIALTIYWIEPASSRTSTVTLATSMTKGLHE